MPGRDRRNRSPIARIERLETRALLSLIDAPPTLTVLNGPGVHKLRSGAVYLVNPTKIQVTGTAQPGNSSTTVVVGIYAEDRAGNFVDGGRPLAVATPDALGRYHATVMLPSAIRKDVNFLVAREEAVGTEVSRVVLDGTTVSGLSGTIRLNPGSVTGLSGSISTPSLGISGIGGTVSNPSTSISGLSGTVSTPSTTLSGLSGSINNPSTSISGLSGNLSLLGGALSGVVGSIGINQFPVTVGGTSGTGGPATGSITALTGTIGGSSGTLSGGARTIAGSTSTLTGGTGTLGATTGTLSGGSGTVAASTATLTGGTGTLAAGTSGFAQSGSATLDAMTGTFTGGTGTIAPMTGTSTQVVDEVAVSEPVTILIHQARARRRG